MLLWTNVAVALIQLIVYAVNPTRSTRDLLQSLAFTFLYANLTSLLAALILGWLMEKAVARGVNPWKLAIPGILVFTTGGCLLAQSLLAALGFSAWQHFWLDCLLHPALRAAVGAGIRPGRHDARHAAGPHAGDGAGVA